ncbi:MAG TPA: hypothetical protein VK191_12150 [Symbiobacteriaceae bacterium]|nr:hypothetical protein [Symbiobacteriaceae bacterium]
MPLALLFLIVVVTLFLSFFAKKSLRSKAILLYWAALLLELLFVFDNPRQIELIILVGVTLGAGAVTIFALPGER